MEVWNKMVDCNYGVKSFVFGFDWNLVDDTRRL